MSKLDRVALAAGSLVMIAAVAATLYLADAQKVEIDEVKNILLRELSDDIASGAQTGGKNWVKVALTHDGKAGSKIVESRLAMDLASTGFVRVIDHEFIRDIVPESASDETAVSTRLPIDCSAIISMTDFRQSSGELSMEGGVLLACGENTATFPVVRHVEKSIFDTVYLMISVGKINPLLRLILLVIVLLSVPFVLSPWSVRMFRGASETRKILVLAKHIVTGVLFTLFYLAFELSLINLIFGVPIILLYSFYSYRYLIAVDASLRD